MKYELIKAYIQGLQDEIGVASKNEPLIGAHNNGKRVAYGKILKFLSKQEEPIASP